MEGTFVNHLNGKLFFETVARIVSEQYGVEVTVTVRPKGQTEQGPSSDAAGGLRPDEQADL